jgi:hypothetical protein
MDGVFIDTEHRRTDAIGTFPGFDLGVFVIEAFDRCGANAFSLGEDAACDAVTVILIDRLAEGFRGVAIAFDAWERRDK